LRKQPWGKNTKKVPLFKDIFGDTVELVNINGVVHSSDAAVHRKVKYKRGTRYFYLKIVTLRRHR
jgi:hypothetical protein